MLNIYDLAGNEFEWTLEKITNTSYPSVIRGGDYNVASNSPAAVRTSDTTSYSYFDLSFRPALW